MPSKPEKRSEVKPEKKINAKQGRTHGLSQPLTGEESYKNDHLTHAAFVSIAILTFITFVGNFTQLQLSAALPTIVSDFGISVTTGQWLTSIFQLVMGVMVPLTAYLTRRFSTRQIVIASMAVFTLGSVFAWLGSSFVLVLIGRLLEAVGTGVMWPVLQITVFSIYPLSRRGMAMGTVGMAMSVAPAIGPTLGGVQTDLNGWRSIFLTLTVIGVISLFLAIFGLRNFGTCDASAKATSSPSACRFSASAASCSASRTSNRIRSRIRWCGSPCSSAWSASSGSCCGRSTALAGRRPTRPSSLRCST